MIPRSGTKASSVKAAAAGILYFAIAFAAGFALGAIRTLFLIPRLGEVAAVSLEAPIILGVSWIAAGFCVRRFAIPNDRPSRLSMGAIAFMLLMLAEFMVSLVLFGRSPVAFAESLTTVAGMIGLAAQIVFALFPLLRNDVR